MKNKLQSRYFIIVLGCGEPWLLRLEGYAERRDAEQSIRWQGRLRDNASEHVVTTYDSKTGYFVADDGKTYTPKIGPYTKEAWADFCLAIVGEPA